MTRPTTSFVILVRNELAHTRACLASIARHTPEPRELVLVDNGSTDGTRAFLRDLDGVVLVTNDGNLGFGGGCNQGIAAATGERILLLNNDVVVTPGWLGELHDALDADPTIGLVGPRSNRVAGLQAVDEVDYDVASLDGLDTWARSWAVQHGGKVERIPRLVGFCVLLERAVVERIGGFDLRYGMGNFEDDDLCLRAGVGGFGCAVAHGSFIHHVGSRTFAAEGIDYRATIVENLARFAGAWQMDASELDPDTGAYAAERIVARTEWDPDIHYAPLVATPDQLVRIDVDADGAVLAVPCDRLDRTATDEALRAALDAVGPDDAVTVVVRIDPRDDAASGLLDAAADAVGDAALPDVVVLDTRDEDDLPLLRRADAVVAHGRLARARVGMARHVGTTSLDLAALAGWVRDIAP